MAYRRDAKRPLSTWLALGHGLLAAILFVVLLPSALRPPPDQASTAAEFSPDAPPDDQQDSIVAALNRGSSATAGAGDGEGPGTELGGDGPTPALPAGNRACPGGFGDPPRQTFSVYSAPCGPAFVGDNGGATAKGVTGSEIRVVMMPVNGRGNPSCDGPVGNCPVPNALDRTFKAYEDFFNRYYQFYGRKLRIIAVGHESNETNNRAAAASMDEQYKPFLANYPDPPGYDESTRRKTVTFGGFQLPHNVYERRAPYGYHYFMDGTKLLRLNAEYICKKLAGRPARYAGDADLRQRTRKFGFIIHEYTDGTSADYESTLKQELAKCDVEPVIILANAYAQGGNSDAEARWATAMTRFRSEGVTTVAAFTAALDLKALTPQADQLNYHPEWFITGATYISYNSQARSNSPTQWQNAFGISPFEMWRPAEEQEFYRAYKDSDPAGTPHDQAGEWLWPILEIWANAIQMAGPNLTPETFRDGLFKVGYRPNDPVWSIGGGFGPSDLTFGDDVAEIWWNPTGTAPDDGQPGRYEFANGGKRFGLGAVPPGDPQVFPER